MRDGTACLGRRAGWFSLAAGSELASVTCGLGKRAACRERTISYIDVLAAPILQGDTTPRGQLAFTAFHPSPFPGVSVSVSCWNKLSYFATRWGPCATDSSPCQRRDSRKRSWYRGCRLPTCSRACSVTECAREAPG